MNQDKVTKVLIMTMSMVLIGAWIAIGIFGLYATFPDVAEQMFGQVKVLKSVEVHDGERAMWNGTGWSVWP